jgi:hypothetical protein
MIDVINEKCRYDGCKSYPSFNFEDKKTPIFCATHRLDQMIDIVNKKCIHEGCKNRASFNVEAEKTAKFCSKHKLENMYDLKHYLCLFKDCKTRASCNYEGKKVPSFCSEHRLQGMINVVSKRCKTHLCDTIVHNMNKNDGYCLYCYIHLFPDTHLTRNYKTKESAVTTFIKKNNPEYDFQIDKKILDGCSKRRPDLLLDLGYQIIIIEIDENKHANYDCSCENKRIMEISQDLAHRPIVFIRFNPDSYEENKSLVSSCWHVNTKGFCIVKKSKLKEWEQRLNTLDETLKYWIDPANKTSKMVEIIELFY